MKLTRYILLLFLTLFICTAHGQGMRVDSNFTYSFKPVQQAHHKRVLIDVFHPTIFKGRTNPYEDKVMLDILEKDGFAFSFFNEKTLYPALKKRGDILVI